MIQYEKVNILVNSEQKTNSYLHTAKTSQGSETGREKLALVFTFMLCAIFYTKY